MSGIFRATSGFVLVTFTAVAAVYLSLTPRPATTTAASPARRTVGFAAWAIPVAMLDVLFAIFVVTQLSTLFAGDAYVLDPKGPSYADYAWDGFLQLVTVTVLTLVVVAAVGRWARRRHPPSGS